MEKSSFKILLFIVFLVHIVFSYVIGTLNPFEFSTFARFFEVVVISMVFYVSLEGL